MTDSDRRALMKELEEKGWVKDKNEDNYLFPPNSLLERKPKSFYVYDAIYIQECLGEE